MALYYLIYKAIKPLTIWHGLIKITWLLQLNLLWISCLFQHAEVPIPTPKNNEVLLKLEAASLNPFDWKVQKGMLRPFLPRKFPHIPVKLVCFCYNPRTPHPTNPTKVIPSAQNFHFFWVWLQYWFFLDNLLLGRCMLEYLDLFAFQNLIPLCISESYIIGSWSCLYMHVELMK